MATVLEFESPVAEFPLGTIFENLPDVTVAMERLIPQEDHIVPYFWVRGAEAADVEAAFEAHPGLENVTLIDSADSESLLRAEWAGDYFGILSALASSNVSLLSGVGTNEGWEFEVRGESREAISEFRTSCQAHDITIEITAVHALLPIQGDDFELTDAQREALVVAFERGYFDSPRRATLEEIAADLDISQQSLSSRLRRAHRRLIAGTIIHG